MLIDAHGPSCPFYVEGEEVGATGGRTFSTVLICKISRLFTGVVYFESEIRYFEPIRLGNK